MARARERACEQGEVLTVGPDYDLFLVREVQRQDASEASPQTDEHVVKCRARRIAPVACIESGMVNHSVEWDSRKANRLAVKAPRNRSRHERTTDRCRGLKQARGVGSGEHRPNVSQRLCPSAQAVEGTLKFIRIHRGHKPCKACRARARAFQ